MILDYESVKDKPKTLRAMTSLDPSEFEKLCNVFSEVWDEHTHQHDKDPAKGGRKPILKRYKIDCFLFCSISKSTRYKKSWHICLV